MRVFSMAARPSSSCSKTAANWGWSFPRMKITDWPAIAYRSVHWDNKNHLDRVEYYYDLIDRLARYKINGVIWEIEDKLRYGAPPGRSPRPNAISKQEVQAICRYAKERNIEISPLIQGLGHATYILKHHWSSARTPTTTAISALPTRGPTRCFSRCTATPSRPCLTANTSMSAVTR